MNNLTKAEKSKKAILDAAREIATEKGYDGTSVREICSRAGLSIGAFYHHFSSKDDVLNSSFLHFDDQITDERISSWDNLSPIDAIKTVLIDQTKFTESIGVNLIREYYRVLLNKGGGGAISPDRIYYKTVRRYVEKAQNLGFLVKSIDSGDITHLLVKSVRGSLVDWCLHGGAYNVTERVSKEFDIAIKAFKKL